MKYIIQHKGIKYTVEIGDKNTKILNSFKIKRISAMKSFITHLKTRFPYCSINKIPLFEVINEWRVHNLLYTLNIKRDRTKDVDLNIGKSWYTKVLYTIISPFYFHFN